MIKSILSAFVVLVALVSVSWAGPDKDTMMEKEKAAWQSFKDKNPDAFQKVVDKDIRCVYDAGIMNMQDELDAMKKWDIKSFTISDFKIFSDEKDVVVATYKVTIDGTADGKDASGTYNAGSVWKVENGKWLAIFHSDMKEAAK